MVSGSASQARFAQNSMTPEGRLAKPVLSTYRLQLRGDCFTFGDAEKLLDYLDELGISHLYLSPILTAVSGSTHGYDVTDRWRLKCGVNVA